MRVETRGRPPVSSLQDIELLAEARSLVAGKRCRSQSAAIRYLAELRGISNEQEQKNLVERLRLRGIRQDAAIEYRSQQGATLK